MTAEITALIIAVFLALVMAAIVWWHATLVHRERQRIATETLLAERQLQAMTRRAMQHMLNVARQHAGDQSHE